MDTHIPASIKERVREKINECRSIAAHKFNREFDMPTITYDVRGCTAGYAYDYNYKVSFNTVLLMENVDDFINRTVPHEFAHLVDGIVYPETRRTGYSRRKRSIHGPTWKSIMRLFGAPTSRCHSYDTSNSITRRKTRHVYMCNTCGEKMVLGPVRHKKQQAGHYSTSATVYWMRGCGYHSKQNGYTYLGLEGQERTAKAASAQKNVKAPKKGTKKAKAIEIYRQNVGKSKDFIISRIALECNMSQTGATTYYYAAKKESS